MIIKVNESRYKQCALRGKCPYSEFFWSVFPSIRTEYLSVFSPNAGKYGSEKFRIRTLFTQSWGISTLFHRVKSIEKSIEKSKNWHNQLWKPFWYIRWTQVIPWLLNFKKNTILIFTKKWNYIGKYPLWQIDNFGFVQTTIDLSFCTGFIECRTFTCNIIKIIFTWNFACILLIVY